MLFWERKKNEGDIKLFRKYKKIIYSFIEVQMI